MSVKTTIVGIKHSHFRYKSYKLGCWNVCVSKAAYWAPSILYLVYRWIY